MEANADRFRMIAVTLPGYAGSPRPALPLWTSRPVLQDNAVRQLSRLIDERRLTDLVVVGQSFGSRITGSCRSRASRSRRLSPSTYGMT